MILVFSVWLEWLPTSGQGDWRNLVMPAVALGWYFAASLLRLTRSSMLEVLRSEYIKLARLKGLPAYAVIAIHAFKNALIPVLTLAGVNLVVMINAAVIIEVIFAWPGIGRLLYEGIFQRDFPLVQGVVMEAGIMIVADQPDRRHPLRLHRSAHPAHQGRFPCPLTTVAAGSRRYVRDQRSAELAAGRAGSLPVLPLAILVPFMFDRDVRQCHRSLRSDRTDPGREDLRATVLVTRRQHGMLCSAPITRAATS